MGNIVDRWNAAYFDNHLAPGAVAALDPLNEANADAQALADRAFRLMRVARNYCHLMQRRGSGDHPERRGLPAPVR